MIIIDRHLPNPTHRRVQALVNSEVGNKAAKCCSSTKLGSHIYELVYWKLPIFPVLRFQILELGEDFND
jgi:hypothetical protein